MGNSGFNEQSLLRISEEGERCFRREKDHLCDPRRFQLQTLMKILEDNKDTEIGKLYSFADIKSYDDYKKAVPFSEYDDYAPYIERMINGDEKNLITVYPITYYALTSGSTGIPKKIPVSEYNRRSFSAYSGNVTIYHLVEQIKKQKHKPGPICFLTEFSWRLLTEKTIIGPISSQMSYNFRDMISSVVTSPRPLQFLCESEPDAQYVKALFALKQRDTSCIIATFSSAIYEMFNLIEQQWEKLVSDIRYGLLGENLGLSDRIREELKEYLSPDPDRADELEKEFIKGFEEPIVPRIWPNMSMLSCIGGSFFSEYTKKIRYRYSADIPIHMMAYGASEAMMAIPLLCNETSYCPLTDSVFIEFRLIDDCNSNECYLMDEVEPGKDYEIIVTNMSGLYRYCMYDVFHVDEKVGNMPKGHIKYRLNQVVSMVGERTTTEQLDSIMLQLAEYLGTDITNYALYPDYSTSPARYVVLAEPDEYLGKGNQAKLGPVIDRFFRMANRSFNKYREQATMGEPLVSFLEPGSFRLFTELQIAQGISSNQVKPVKLIDNKQKTQFFFGLSEGPYKAVQRVLFDSEQKAKEVRLLRNENEKLKRENSALKKQLKEQNN